AAAQLSHNKAGTVERVGGAGPAPRRRGRGGRARVLGHARGRRLGRPPASCRRARTCGGRGGGAPADAAAPPPGYARRTPNVPRALATRVPSPVVTSPSTTATALRRLTTRVRQKRSCSREKAT